MSLQGTNIAVVVRLRPILPKELQKGHQNTMIHSSLQTQSVMQILHSVNNPDSRFKRKFKFDQVFSEQIGQQDLYNQCKLDQLIKKLLEGYNATIFAYGQTGSGKTFTMEGFQYDRNLKPIITDDSQSIGITPRVLRKLFDDIRKKTEVDTKVHCSFLQIYKEKIFDLLNKQNLAKSNGPGLRLRWNHSDEFYVENLNSFPCENLNDVLNLFYTGIRNKVMASHNMNYSSSRSHCILSLTVETINRETGQIMSSKLQLVDLAGSEKSSLTGNQGQAMKEAIEINKSLFTLRQVITAQSSLKSGENVFVPFRDSKLTSLLKQGIGGNSYSLMIACIAPIDKYFDENISTLTYATRASSISNEPVRNIDPKTKIVKELRGEIKQLKQELGQAYNQIEILTKMLESKNGTAWGNETQPIQTNTMHQKRMSSDAKRYKEYQKAPKTANTPQSIITLDTGESCYLTPELLSEKLHDSVKMIKDLLNNNKRLKDTVSDLTNARRQFEVEKSHIYIENEELREKVEILEGMITVNSPNQQYVQLHNEKEELQRRVQQLEAENLQMSQFYYKSNNKTKSNRNKTVKPMYQHYQRNNENLSFQLKPLKPLSPVKVRDQRISDELADYNQKDKAIDALSKLLLNRAAYRKRHNKLV